MKLTEENFEVESLIDDVISYDLKQQILDYQIFYNKFHNEHVYSFTEEEMTKFRDNEEKLEKIKDRWNFINVDLDAAEDCVKMCHTLKEILDAKHSMENRIDRN